MKLPNAIPRTSNNVVELRAYQHHRHWCISYVYGPEYCSCGMKAILDKADSNRLTV